MNFHLIKHFFKHQFKAGNAHGLHSPFVFEFYNECIKSKSKFYKFQEIESIRKKLSKSTEVIKITDFGAGSKVSNQKSRMVKDITKNSIKPSFLGQQLFRMVNFLNPRFILDIGTSLGITTSYLGAVNHDVPLTTLEGCTNTANIARNVFQELKLNHIQLIEGEFSTTLPQAIYTIESLDFVFFDGNHQYQPTLDYFNLCISRANEHTCFIFDDIYWSKGMTKAWNEIINDERVTLSIDTFYFGIVFFRTNQPKQHFILK